MSLDRKLVPVQYREYEYALEYNKKILFIHSSNSIWLFFPPEKWESHGKIEKLFTSRFNASLNIYMQSVKRKRVQSFQNLQTVDNTL